MPQFVQTYKRTCTYKHTYIQTHIHTYRERERQTQRNNDVYIRHLIKKTMMMMMISQCLPGLHLVLNISRTFTDQNTLHHETTRFGLDLRTNLGKPYKIQHQQVLQGSSHRIVRFLYGSYTIHDGALWQITFSHEPYYSSAYF